MNYKPLQTEFKKAGFYFKQLKRVGDIALFEKSNITPIGKVSSYEVVIVQRHDDYMMAGTKIEAKEHICRNEDWGINGWTFVDLQSAEKKFEKLIK